MTQPATTYCFRCGYDLQGIADDRPCPECGLLAERSRRTSDELRDSRPRWLRCLSIGIWLILIGLALGGGWVMFMTFFEPPANVDDFYEVVQWASPAIMIMAAVLLLAGAILATVREGYPPADHRDRYRRWLIRVFASMPLIAMAVVPLLMWLGTRTPGGWDAWAWLHWIVIGGMTIGSVPFPALGFRQLQNLARRAGSWHLAEHCTIVGIGTSLTMAGAFVALAFTDGDLGFDEMALAGTLWPLIGMTVLALSLMLFWLWSIYLAIRFAVSFGRAARQAHQKWIAADMAR